MQIKYSIQVSHTEVLASRFILYDGSRNSSRRHDTVPKRSSLNTMLTKEGSGVWCLYVYCSRTGLPEALFRIKDFSGLLFIACIRLVLPFVAEQVKAFKLGESFLSANSVAKFASQGQMG